jgi:hypothetical protein
VLLLADEDGVANINVDEEMLLGADGGELATTEKLRTTEEVVG